MQKYAAVIWIVGFDFIGLPLAYVFMFVANMNIYGFWLAMIIAEILTNVSQFIILWRFNFLAYAEEVRERVCLKLPSESPKYGLLSNESIPTTETTGEEIELSNVSTAMKTELVMPTSSDNVKSGSEQQLTPHVATTPEESLFKLLRYKLLVLIPLICLFIVCLVFQYRP